MQEIFYLSLYKYHLTLTLILFGSGLQEIHNNVPHDEFRHHECVSRERKSNQQYHVSTPNGREKMLLFLFHVELNEIHCQIKLTYLKKQCGRKLVGDDNNTLLKFP